jgi:CheY-like chemotaxis protein
MALLCFWGIFPTWPNAHVFLGSRGLPASAPTQRSILLVEDQENDAILIKLAFERARVGYPIYSVPGGLQAIAYLSGDPPYQDRFRYPLPLLLLLDIRMPGVDGFEVLKWIRQRPEFEKLPVVMLTGSNETRDAHTAYQLGATSFLVKSVDFANASELSRTVERLISTGQP